MPLRHNILLIALLSLLFPLMGYGQTAVTIRGVTYKKNSLQRVSQALITDLNSKTIMMSDELGMFSIKAAIGDTLLITKADFTPQKRVIISAEDMAVFLIPVIQLEQVTIQGQTKKQELNEVMGQYRSQGTFYAGKPPVLSFLTSPVTGLYELFGKTPQRARRFAEFSKRELESTEVNRRYTKALVKRTTNLPDEEVEKFMNIFTPSYEDLKQWNDYQLISYIKRSLEYYQKNKGRDTVQMDKLY